MYKDIFVQLGLTNNESIIYEYLLKKGENSAGEIIKNTPLKRGVIYNTLADLENKGLISQKMAKPKDANSSKVQKIAFFSPNHPEKLRNFLESQENQVKKAKNTLESNLPEIISSFNLVSNKPGVRYFEGIEGIKKVIYDTFNSNEEVYTYADIETINKYIKDINEEYARKRDEMGLNKKILFSDTPYTREVLKQYHTKTTNSRIIKGLNNFYTVMQIYDNKISYITLSDEIKIGVIIESKDIYHAHKSLFESTWKNAMTLEEITTKLKQ